MREELFFRLEFSRVHTAAAATQFDGEFKVQHLVIDDVLDRVTRYTWMIENTTNDDDVVGGIVVSQTVAGVILTPRQVGTSQKAKEEAQVQFVEELVQVVYTAAMRVNAFSSSHLADQVGLTAHVVTRNVFAIASGEGPIDGFAVHLRQQDVGDGPQHAFRRALQ